MNDTHIDSNSFVSHSIIGRGTTIDNNFSGVSGKTTVEIEGEFKKLDHMGVMIGEDTDIDNHVVVDPGVIVGRKCKINSMNRITKSIPSGSKVM